MPQTCTICRIARGKRFKTRFDGHQIQIAEGNIGPISTKHGARPRTPMYSVTLGARRRGDEPPLHVLAYPPQWAHRHHWNRGRKAREQAEARRASISKCVPGGNLSGRSAVQSIGPAGLVGFPGPKLFQCLRRQRLGSIRRHRPDSLHRDPFYDHRFLRLV